MKPPERKEIAAIIASPCLIQKDRAGRALFVSDFLRRADKPQEVQARLQSNGFVCEQLNERLMLIDWTHESYAAYFNALPEINLLPFTDDNAMIYGTCKLLMQHKVTLESQDTTILSYCLRLAHLGEKDKMLHTLQSALADALRERRAPPYHGAKLCLSFFWT